MYKGQPVPSTLEHVHRAKVSDGKSVKVTVPASREILPQKFYLLDGFFGVATEHVVTGEGETAEVILTIEQSEYETDDIITTDEFARGDTLYFDGSKFTVAADDGSAEPAGPIPYRKVGRVTVGKDANNVIWFLLGPQI